GAAHGGVSTWGDARAAALPDGSAHRADLASLYELTGCPPWPVYAPARLPWLRRAADGGPNSGARVQTLKEWIFHRFTGHDWIDFVTASTTGLLDIRRREWSSAALSAAGIQAGALPELVPSSAAAPLLGLIARGVGLPGPVPMIVGAADGPLVNLALGADAPGDISLSMGTTAAVRLVTAEPWIDPGGRTWCYRFHPDGFIVGGAVNNAGLLLDWARRVLYAGVSTQAGFQMLLGEDVRTVPPGADGVRMRPFLVAERDPAAGAPAASFEGVLERHGRPHLARAVVDAVAMSLAALGDILLQSGHASGHISIAGLPARYPAVGQIICDCLGRPVRLARLPDASAIGAALIGYEALGMDRPPVPAETRWLAPEPNAAAAYSRLRCDPLGAEPRQAIAR
ncbi:MAG TPA: FGGY family carbohydrate kinase, partial [Egibacteraceae bacterium]|nr:FGGY family carbohydrate kinase [Egibacteraceae bacterium]